MPITLKTKITELSGVGPKYREKLKKLDINSVEDLLLYLPKKWEDFTKITPIGELREGEKYCIDGNIWSIGNKRSYKRGIYITEAIIADKTGTIKAVWFNQPFLTKNLKEGDNVLLAGKIEKKFGVQIMSSPAYERKSGDLKHLGKIVPIYKETEGLSSKWLRYQISKLVKVIYSFKEYLPGEVMKRQNLLSYPAMIRQLHFPENSHQLDKALQRLNFDEMFLLQLAIQEQKKKMSRNKAISINFNESLLKNIVKSLDFSLTKAQKKSIWEIIGDMGKPHPMNRLLEGDVGSGKTIVAALAISQVISDGFQAVFMAPTEILAGQHYKSLKEILGDFDIEVTLLTGKMKKSEKEEIIGRVKEGEVQVLVGTHAVFNEELEFWNLALVVVDEQHRFGVEQRKKIREKSGSKENLPHFLSMSATPIPRTLTLSIFGDLDISMLDEMPEGRKKVATFIIPPHKKEDSYEFIRRGINKGRQIFVICPLINDSETMELKSVTAEYEKLSRLIFPDFKVSMIHGKMRGDDKKKIMHDFSKGKIDILISTSLIEVGVDIPNATIMIIEGADRFGLSQLHQFRGRVGRGQYQSYCFLFTDSESEKAEKRLEAITKTSSGFDIAERDLEIRGPGEVLGDRQHGMADINTKNLMDVKLVKRTKTEANYFLKKNNVEDFPKLAEKIIKYEGVANLE